MRIGAGPTYLAVLFTLWARPSQQDNYMSHTNDVVILRPTTELCPESPTDLQWMGDFNLTHYKRQPHSEHLRHRRALDQSGQAEVHPEAQLSDQMHGLYKYPLLLPSISIQTAVSNLGDTRRLERVLWKFITGKPVKVVALGGSVTVGHGPENKQLAWLYRVFDWLAETFPHPDHKFINEAIPAITSSYIAPCIFNMVTEDTDLILLEFTFNDGERTGSHNMEEPTRLGLERLLRKLLRMETKPALLNVHYHPFNVYNHFWDGGQDRMEMLFKYYAVPSLSMRSAMHRLLSEQSWLKSKIWRDIDAHPTCVGSKYLADVVIGFLQDMAASVMLTYHGQEHQPHAGVLIDQLPNPVFEGNTAEQLEKCILEEDFHALENGNKGWQWLDEGRHPGQHKWGFISWNPGEDLVLTVPIVDFLPMLHEDRRLLVGLGVLMSYEHGGWMHVDCVNGCSCERREVNTNLPFRYSLTYWKALDVTIDQGSESCELYCVNSEKSMTGEHKVKLTSLLVSLELNSFVESWKFEN